MVKLRYLLIIHCMSRNCMSTLSIIILQNYFNCVVLERYRQCIESYFSDVPSRVKSSFRKRFFLFSDLTKKDVGHRPYFDVADSAPRAIPPPPNPGYRDPDPTPVRLDHGKRANQARRRTVTHAVHTQVRSVLLYKGGSARASRGRSSQDGNDTNPLRLSFYCYDICIVVKRAYAPVPPPPPRPIDGRDSFRPDPVRAEPTVGIPTHAFT